MSRPIGRVLALAAAFALAVLGVLVRPGQAYAATSDQIESFAIDYDVRPDGSVVVTETIDLTFGGLGRHGFDRTLVTREKWDEQRDAEYAISVLGVRSPTGAATSYTTRSAENGSDGALAIRVGSPDRYVDERETYVLTYSVRGAMRAFADHDEFSWDATGFDWTMPIRNVTVHARTPQPPTDTVCFAGSVQAKSPCTSKAVRGGAAEFTQASLARGQGLTIGVMLPKGAVTDAQPRLVPNAGAVARQQAALVAGGTGVTALLAPLLGWLTWRRFGRDDRFVGQAPGSLPPDLASARVAPSPRLNIPVAFSPPRIPVGEAGMLIDGAVDVRDTTATLIDLAVRGAVGLSDRTDGGFTVTLLDPSKAAAAHETVLLMSLFQGAGPGTAVEVGERGTMTLAHDAVAHSLRSQVTARGWFHSVPGGDSGARLSAGGLVVTLIAAAWFIGPQLSLDLLGTVFGGSANPLMWLVPLVPVVLTVVVVRAKLRRGRRTAVGRAVTDQIEGFRTYLATAEANQLRFEEGEDIFSKYLPWAIMLEQAERWATVCRQLVEAGRIPEPTWYVGYRSPFDVIYINDSLTRSTLPEMPAPSVGSGSSGWGGGSSFGGGGFAGSGGGGGGGSTW